MRKQAPPSADPSRPTVGVGPLGLLGVAGLLMGLGGCAGNADLAKQVDALRAEVSSVRATNAALQERVDALEIQGGKLTSVAAPPAEPGTGPAASPPQDSGAPPELRVVRLTPAEDATGTSEIEQGARVKIRSTPNGLVQEDAGSADASDTAAAAELKKAKDFYDKKAWGDALKAFSAFTQRYPEHAKIPEATYYKGLCQAARGDTKLAAETFETVSSSFPRSDIAPDALYEAMKARDKLGDKEGADRARNKLKKDFPKSAAAKKLEKK